MSDHVEEPPIRNDPNDPATWEFHRHLDMCLQCRTYPFDLCPVGAAALQRTAVALAVKYPYRGAK